MPLDDMVFGPELKLANVSMHGDELIQFIGKEGIGLEEARGVSDAVIMCDNPSDHEGSKSHAKVFVKGVAAEVDLAMDHIRSLGLKIIASSEVYPYAPAELYMEVLPEHRNKVTQLIPEVAHETHTEIQPNAALQHMSAIRIIGRQADCHKALDKIQSQLEKKLWTVESRTLRPGQTFGEAAYMESDHPMMQDIRNKKSGVEESETSNWKTTSVVCLTQVECLVLTVNDFGDFISAVTHAMVKETVANYPSDDAIRKTLTQYKQWDRYKGLLTSEIKDYNADRNNFGLPHHMPTMQDNTHGHHYLHMHVERDSPENKPPKKPHRVKRTALLPPKIGLDQFSRK